MFRSYTINAIRTLTTLNLVQITEAERIKAFEKYSHFKAILAKNTAIKQTLESSKKDEINFGKIQTLNDQK